MSFPTAYSKPTGFIVDVGFIVVGDNLEAIGATVGGIKWDPKKTVREVEFDGKYGPIAGMQRTIKYEPMLSGKIKRGGADFISLLEPGAESDGSSGSDGNVITLLDARTPWTVDMMLENVYYVGRQEDGDTFYVHFPRLDPGDVVELLYRVEDIAPRNAFADYFGEVVYMQSTEPIARSEYVLITPKSRAFYFNKPTVPNVTQKVEEKGDQKIFHFVAADVPPLEPEPMMPPLTEVLGHVHVSTYKSWDDMGRWYWGLVKDQFVADEEVRRRVQEITKGLTDEKDKVRAVYDFVVQKTRYVALEFGIHGFKPYRCAQIFARGFGDCKDKATLIVTMLKELGIPATIVILRTGLRGDFGTDVASLAPFDHAIAYVPSMDTYLDGTAEFTGSTELPSMDRGALAIQINEGKPKLVHLPNPDATQSVASKHIDATLANDGSAQIDWKIDVSGSSASAWRGRYHAKATQKQRVQEDLSSELAGVEISEVKANDLDDVEQKVSIKAKGKAPSLARKDGEAWTAAVGAREHLVRTYAAGSTRKRDIRIQALSTQENETVLKLPVGAKITSAPHAAEGKSPYGFYKVETETNGNTVRVKTTVAMTKSRISASEYPAFRSFCEQADRDLGQTVTYAVGK